VVDQPRSLSGASVAADVPQTTTLRIQRRQRQCESRREATVIVSVESVELGACVADAVLLLSPGRMYLPPPRCPSTAATRGPAAGDH
jgi:hypothetical protein